MDTKQIEYILKIAEENNITHAAEKLHLTQPALNQQLLRLERESHFFTVPAPTGVLPEPVRSIWKTPEKCYRSSRKPIRNWEIWQFGKKVPCQ